MPKRPSNTKRQPSCVKGCYADSSVSSDSSVSTLCSDDKLSVSECCERLLDDGRCCQEDNCDVCPCEDSCGAACDNDLCKDHCCTPSPKVSKKKSKRSKKSKDCKKDCDKDCDKCCDGKYVPRSLSMDSCESSISSESSLSLLSGPSRDCCDQSCEQSCEKSCDDCDDCGCDKSCDKSCDTKCCGEKKDAEDLFGSETVKKISVTFGTKTGHVWAKYNTEDNALYLNGKPGPVLNLRRGETYHVTVLGDGHHSFFLTDSPIGGLGSQMIKGGFEALIPKKGKESSINFTVTRDFPHVGFYQCSKYAFQGGVFIVRD